MDCGFVLKKQGKVIAKQKGIADLQQMLCAIDAVITKEQGN
jgi:hypothetical protein